MLFRKEIEPRCAYCRYGAPADDNMVICRKKGIVPQGNHCRRFHYDPFRRVPARPKSPDFTEYDQRDYSL